MAKDRTAARDGRGHGWFERFVFRFMGPPDVGDVHAPVRPPRARPVELCERCGRPFDEHEVVRQSRLTYTKCPGEAPR